MPWDNILRITLDSVLTAHSIDGEKSRRKEMLKAETASAKGSRTRTLGAVRFPSLSLR